MVTTLSASQQEPPPIKSSVFNRVLESGLYIILHPLKRVNRHLEKLNIQKQPCLHHFAQRTLYWLCL